MKMNFKLKTLLALSGAALLSVPALRAQSHGFGGGARGAVASRSSAAGRSAFAARPAGRALANNASLSGSRGLRGGSYYRGGNYHHGYGRYYYLGGIPYFFPFYGYGFGYGGFCGDGFYGDGFYGDGFGAGGGYGDGAYGNAGGVAGGPNGGYQGRVTNGRNGQNAQSGDETEGSGPSLPTAVQRQLSKRGYYKGTVDGEFGPASRDALKKFQKSQGLKPTGNIDEDSLDALGFTDRRQ